MKPMMRPISWFRFDGFEKFDAYYDQERFSALRAANGKLEEIDNLPVEMFARELIEVDCKDDEALIDFVTRFGLPLNPLRYSERGIGRVLDEGRSVLTLGAINEVVGGNYFAEVFHMACTDEIAAIPSPWFGRSPYMMGLEEIADAVSRLQAMSKSVLRFTLAESSEELTGNDKFNLTVLGNAATRPEYMSLNASPGWPDDDDFWSARRFSPNRSCNLTHVICNQMMDFLSDDARLRRCKNGKCGRWFKHKRGAKNPTAYSDYCSRKCQEAETKWRQRNPGKVRGWMLDESEA